MIIIISLPFSPLINQSEEVRNELLLNYLHPFVKNEEINDFEFHIMVILVDSSLRGESSDNVVLIIKTIVDISNSEW